jgi:hypothetical protein
MHRSSGAKKFRKDDEYFRINLVQQGSFFVDKMGNPSQNPEETHLVFSNCADVENLIYNLINKPIK